MPSPSSSSARTGYDGGVANGSDEGASHDVDAAVQLGLERLAGEQAQFVDGSDSSPVGQISCWSQIDICFGFCSCLGDDKTLIVK